MIFQKISSLQHPLVKHLVKVRQSRSYRYENGTIVIEGKKLVGEVCLKQEALRILTVDESLIGAGVKAKEGCLVTQEIMKKISGLQSPEGVLAEVEMPSESVLDGLRYIVAFDGIGDPGNLGTLLRTALALGWQGAFLFNNCCDPYNDKALRAAKGATFLLPMRQGSWEGVKALIEREKLLPVAADIEGENINDFSSENGIFLVLGSEARGLSAETQAFCRKLTIPMSGKMESLNVSVAGGILMHRLIRQ